VVTHRTLRPPHVPRVAASNAGPFPTQDVAGAGVGGGAGPQQADPLAGEPLTGELTARQIQQLDKLLKEKMDNLDLQTFQGLRPVGEDHCFGHDVGGTARTLQPNFDFLVFDATGEHRVARAIAENAAAALNAARAREADALAAAAAAAGAEAAQAEQGGPQARLTPPSPPWVRVRVSPQVPHVAARRPRPPGSCTTRGCTPYTPPHNLDHVPRVAQQRTLRPCVTLVPRVAYDARITCHAWPQRRTSWRPVGACACTTRGRTPHAPPPCVEHVPRVASDRTPTGCTPTATRG